MSQRQPRRRDERYLIFVRTQPCCVCWRPAPSDAAHIRMASTVYGKRSTGMAEKPDDKWAVPLCKPTLVARTPSAGCHILQHSMNESAFWRSRGINPFEIAKRLYAEGGHPDDPQPKRRKAPIKSRGFAKGPKRKISSRGFSHGRN